MKTTKVLPKTMRGTVHKQFKKCGKSNCKCASGNLHGTYYYHFVRIDGKLVKRYLKADDVDQIRLACQLRQQQQQKQNISTEATWKLLRELRESLSQLNARYGRTDQK